MKHIIKEKHIIKQAGYPHRFIEHVIEDFMKTKDDKLVPDWLFDVREKDYFIDSKTKKTLKSLLST